MKQHGVSFWCAPAPRAGQTPSELVIPLWPVTERLASTSLPTGGISLMTGTTTTQHVNAAYERFMKSPQRRRLTFYSCYADIELPDALSSAHRISPDTLPDTSLLVLESLRVDPALAEKVTHDYSELLKNDHHIRADPALTKSPRTFALISAYPFLIKDLLNQPDYCHLKALVYVLRPAPGVLKHRYVYIRDVSVVTRLTLAGDDPLRPWRWPTPEELENPPDEFNPYAEDSESDSGRRRH